MWDRTAAVYAQGDSSVARQPSRDFVPSPWAQAAIEKAQSSGIALTAAIVIGVIFLLGRRK